MHTKTNNWKKREERNLNFVRQLQEMMTRTTRTVLGIIAQAFHEKVMNFKMKSDFELNKARFYFW